MQSPDSQSGLFLFSLQLMLKMQLSLLLKRVLLVFAFYSLSRFLFLIFNFSVLGSIAFAEIISVFFFSLRFDAAAIAITNSLFIVLSLLPFKNFLSKGYQKFLKSIFLLVNIPCLFFNLLDVGYYRFQLKRTTADFFKFVTLSDDLKNTLPKILADFWYLLALFIFLSALFIYCYNKIITYNTHKAINAIWYQWLIILPGIGIIVLAARGGIQFKPISILSAAKYASIENVALVLNTPFTIIKTFGKEELSEAKYFQGNDLNKIYSPIHKYENDSAFKNLNIVILIMESFSKEYIGYFNDGKGYTPFLDSLITQSLVCTNAYANGKRSIEGIPAVLSGIPSMMNNAYITSTYNGNKLNSLPLLLRDKNYTTAFYHGGNNGTMGFDSYTKMAGYDRYVGRNEYPGKDYDGDWGIYDEPFMQFFCTDISQIKQPFHAALFSLSSHHPYSLPAKYKDVFKEGSMPIHKTVSYADYSLKQFFISAQKQNWYNNTLFVITADHTGPSENPLYQNKEGVYAIPIIYYMPSSNLKGTSKNTTQQADIVPSVLDFLNYNQPFKFYGESIFDSTANHFAMSYIDGIYQYINSNTLLHFDGEKTIDCYKHDTASLKEKINASDKVCIDAEKKVKAFIQDFNHSMINNKLTSTE